MVGPRKELIPSLFQIDKWKFGRCLGPKMTCKNKGIKSHSIQNAKILDLLVDQGHVIGFTRKMDINVGPIVSFGKIGRNDASTFSGLCAKHDQKLFAPIDLKDLYLNDQQQLFLLAYRAVLRELHATMEGAAKIQMMYLKRVELGLSPRDQPSKEGMYAIERMMVSYETYQYKLKFDKAYMSKSYNVLSHDVIVMSEQKPTIASSTLFSMDSIKNKNDVARAAINVLPIRLDTSIVVLSYLSDESHLCRAYLDKALTSHDSYQKYEISKILLNHCENIVISPKYFDEWTERKKDIVNNYYTRTILKNDLAYDNPDLFLF
jgi:hypothetical protein